MLICFRKYKYVQTNLVYENFDAGFTSQVTRPATILKPLQQNQKQATSNQQQATDFLPSPP